MTTELLRTEYLTKRFTLGGWAHLAGQPRTVKAVDAVTFSITEGTVLGLVGESGCGKSTVARLLMGLIKPTFGRIWFDGKDITTLSKNELTKLRLRMQMVFQDPYGSLNPRMSVGDSVGYSLRVHRLYEGKALQAKVRGLLERVGLSPAYAKRFPHELSGGQQQRVGIARAIAVGPKLVIADEPVSSLDVSTQAQVLNLFRELQVEQGITYLFITHDLSVAEYLSDRIMVMYSGKIVEMGHRKDVLRNPKHPYTQALLSAAFLGDRRNDVKEIILEGDPPSATNPPLGCRFNPRCPTAVPECRNVEPMLRFMNQDHMAACHLARINGSLA